MVPTLRDGDAVVVRRGAPVRPGDVVVGRFDDVSGLVVKRVVRAVGDRWWLESDNEFVTDDSRRYGPAIVDGRVLLRYLPWRRLGLLRPSPR
jgi:phage repressor protein C with HTH and peptisase S24 domain